MVEWFGVSYPGGRKSAIKEIREFRASKAASAQYKYKLRKASGGGYIVSAARRKSGYRSYPKK